MNYKELSKFYEDNFSLSYLNTDFIDQVALISLICYLTQQMQKKKPGINCYEIIMKIATNEAPIDFLESLSIVCQSFYRINGKYETFNIKDSKTMISKIREILRTYVPF